MFDEPHRYISPRQKNAYSTMVENLPKRKASDPWAMLPSTMYAPGEGSVLEDLHRQANEVLAGKIKDPRLLFDHRQADERLKLTVRRDLEKAITQASGDAIAWTDMDAIIARYLDLKSQGNEPRFRRFWLNQAVKGTSQWIDVALWDRLADVKRAKRGRPADGTPVVLAFDGSYSRDSTALIGATVEDTPYIWAEAVWERPFDGEGRPDVSWRTPRGDVEDAIEQAMERYDVLELAPDPPGWHKQIEEWEQTYGEIVVRFETNQPKRIGPACDNFKQAAADRELSHDGSEVIRRHLGNCLEKDRNGHKLAWKPPDSPHKIDAAIGAIVALERATWRHMNQPSGGPLFAFG